MNAAAAKVVAIGERRIDVLDCFVARADARALLWRAGEYSLPEAVDVLQRDAERDGLIKRIGQDAVQAILADAFRPFHNGQEQTTDQQQVLPESIQTQRRRTPRATVEAILYCVRTRGLGALKQAANLERLSRCDPVARIRINRRIAALIEKGMPHEST